MAVHAVGQIETGAPILIVVIGIVVLDESSGRDPWPWSRKRSAVESCCTNQHDRTKARRRDLQFCMDLGVAIPTVDAALEARILSAMKDERVAASKVLTGPARSFDGDRTGFLVPLQHSIVGNVAPDQAAQVSEPYRAFAPAGADIEAIDARQ